MTTTRFKVTRTHKNGQQSSLFISSDKIKTVRGLMQHKREELIDMTGFQAGDSITAEIVEVVGEKVIIDDVEYILSTSKEIGYGDTVYNPLSDAIMEMSEADDDDLDYANDNYYFVTGINYAKKLKS